MDPVRQDCWGIPIPHIRCKMGAEEQKLLKCQEIEAAFPETVKAAGDQTEFPCSPKGIRDWAGTPRKLASEDTSESVTA
tara:strand:- start:154 stop:390 length:237 start_codon:yes stop_codon:yes gene_type:complete